MAVRYCHYLTIGVFVNRMHAYRLTVIGIDLSCRKATTMTLYLKHSKTLLTGTNDVHRPEQNTSLSYQNKTNRAK